MSQNELMAREQIRKVMEGHFVYPKMALMRLWCQLQKPDQRLLQLKNTHCGQRCFIVATGPSLRLEDVNRLKNEWTFSLNSCINFFDKTEWRPNYYLCFDPQVYLSLKDKIRTADLEMIFYNSFSIPKFCRDGIPCIVDSSNVTYANSKYGRRHPRPAKVSMDASQVIYEGTSTVFSAIQLAIYMGFTEIYLLGCDCNYQKQKHASIASYEIDTPSSTGEKMIRDYENLNQALKGTDVRIYNATRGGMLETFERVNIDKIVAEEMVR